MENSSIKSLEDVDEYVLGAISKLKNDDNLIEMEKQYRIASLMIGIGKFKESLPFFKNAFEQLRKENQNAMWKDIFCSAGTLYANTLDHLGDPDHADTIFKEIVELNPTGCHIGDYAMFLHKRKKDNKKAESLYKKCIELYPNHSSILLKYAGFMRHIRKNTKKAEELYKKAISVNPNNAEALGNYASFLHGNEEHMATCQDLYERAVKNDPTHANNYCNFGLFLSEEKQEYEYSERMYKHALLVAPKHSNTLYNYAVMLDTHLNRKEEAELLYRQALEIDPKHSYALYNLAVLLEEIALDRGEGDLSKKEIASLYKAASEADPHDAASAADYGRFLLVRFDNMADFSEPYLLKALKLDGENEVALYNLGLLCHKYKLPLTNESLNLSLEMYRRLVAKNPNHLSGLLQLARLLIEINSNPEFENSTATGAFANNPTDGKNIKTNSVISSQEVDSTKVDKAWMEEVIELYEVIIPRHKEPSTIVCEYARVVNKYGSPRQKMRAISTTEGYLRQSTSSKALSLSSKDDSSEYGFQTNDISRVLEAMKNNTKQK